MTLREQQDQEMANAYVVQAEAMERLIQTEGWKILRTYLEGQIAQGQVLLMNCGPEELGAVRAKVRSVQDLLKYPDALIHAGRTAEAELRGGG